MVNVCKIFCQNVLSGVTCNHCTDQRPGYGTRSVYAVIYKMDCPIEASEAVVEVHDVGQKSDTVRGPAGRVDESAPDGATRNLSYKQSAYKQSQFINKRKNVTVILYDA